MSSVTAAEVRAWSDIQASDTMINLVIDAVDAFAATTYEIPEPAPADARLGLVMQCSRLLKRRKTPEGVAVFGSDVAIRISRFDPDIAAMLSAYEPARLGLG